MTRCYRIGRVNIRTESDIDFKDTSAINPFICEECEAEIRLIFQGTDNLELPVGERIFKNQSVHIYKTDSGTEKVFFLPASDKYAAVIKKVGNAYVCIYDRKYSDYFSFAVNMLNTVGLEKIES